MSAEPAYIDIVRRKRLYRSSQIPAQWLIPASSPDLPIDPPTAEHGRQTVLDTPRKYLTEREIQITESYTVKSLLSALSSGNLTVMEVTTAFAHRTALAGQLVNCLTEPLFTRALNRADFLDDYRRRTGRVFGPLHGLPVSVKDTFDVAGYDSTMGLASLCFKPVSRNAPLVDLLESLGCVILTKTNVPQTVASLDSNNNVFGRTMNPLNRMLTAGGSSGGEGALVAMKGVMMGFGTDIGGSIRLPAWCNGVVGFTPSSGLLPYGGQVEPQPKGVSRATVGAVAGPLGRSVEDIDVVLGAMVPAAKMFAGDCRHAEWKQETGQLRKGAAGSGEKGEYMIGVLRSDNNCALLPPITNMLDEVSSKLRASSTLDIQVVDLPTPTAWTRCQNVMNKLMGAEANNYIASLINATSEPLVPWTAKLFRTGNPRTLAQIAEFQAARNEIEQEMNHIWYSVDEHGRKTRKVDAIICPLAPHPVPEIDRYGSVGYTSSWVMLDYPAGSVPVRDIQESDLQLGRALPGQALNNADSRCRDLWDEGKTDRRVYLGSVLNVQVVCARGDNEALIRAMTVVEAAIRDGEGNKSVKSRL